MKKCLAVAVVFVLLSPALAFAGSSTDAALALGAFAVFNQIISGTACFGGIIGRPAVAAPVVYASPAPAVVYAPPPPVVFAPPPIVIAPAPSVFVAPAPPVVVTPRAYYAPVYRKVPRHAVVARGWCPPGHVKHGRCY